MTIAQSASSTARQAQLVRECAYPLHSFCMPVIHKLLWVRRNTDNHLPTCAQASMILVPVGTLPVKDILAMSGWWHMSWPVSALPWKHPRSSSQCLHPSFYTNWSLSFHPQTLIWSQSYHPLFHMNWSTSFYPQKPIWSLPSFHINWSLSLHPQLKSVLPPFISHELSISLYPQKLI